MNKPTPAQQKFLRELFRDIERSFLATPGKTERDLAAYFAGIFKKHQLVTERRFFETRQQVLDELDNLTSRQAWRFIPALRDLRDRLDTKAPRDQVKTPRNLLSAIWTAAADRQVDKDLMQEIVHSVTNGQTTSTSRLRRTEALEIINRLRPTTRIIEMVDAKDKTVLRNRDQATGT